MWPAVGSTTGPGPTASQPITPLSGCPLTHGASIPPVCNGISRLTLMGEEDRSVSRYTGNMASKSGPSVSFEQ